MDNIFTERLWRSVKWEEVYLKEYENASEAYSGLERYFDFYNQVRPHQSLGYATPAQVYAGEVIPEAICISKPVKGAKTVPEIGEAAPGKSVAPSVLFK